MPSIRRRGRKLSVVELRQYHRQMLAHDAEDARENLQQIRGGVLAGVLRRPRTTHDGRELTDRNAFVKPLWTCADGSKALEAIGEMNYEGRKAFVELLRLTRLLDHFEDEVVMGVAKELRVARLSAGSQISPTENCFAIVVSGSLRVSLPRKHARTRRNARKLREQIDVIASKIPQPPPAATKRALAATTPRADRAKPGSEIIDSDRAAEEQLLHESIDTIKLVDEVCELHVGDVFRPGSSSLILPDGSSRLLTVESRAQDALVVLISTARFNACVQQWSTASSKARSNGASSMTVGEMQDQLMRMPLLSGISQAAACTLAHVAKELVPARTGPDAATIRPAFASGYSALTDQRVILRQNAPARSIYLLLSGPATVVYNHDPAKQQLLTDEKRATGIQTASSRNMDDDEAAGGHGDVPPEQPDNNDLFESVRRLCLLRAQALIALQLLLNGLTCLPISTYLMYCGCSVAQTYINTLSGPTFFGESALQSGTTRNASVLAPRSSKVAFLRAADFLFFVDAHMAERAREIAKFRMELRPKPQVRPASSISIFCKDFASALIVSLILSRR